MIQHYALQDLPFDDKPYAVIRHDTETGRIERYNDGEWFSCPRHGDVVMGGESGAHMISGDEAAQLTRSGTLVILPPDAVERFRGKA